MGSSRDACLAQGVVQGIPGPGSLDHVVQSAAGLAGDQVRVTLGFPDPMAPVSPYSSHLRDRPDRKGAQFSLRDVRTG